MYQKTTLNNGVRIVSASMRDIESLAVGVWVKTGSRYEQEELCGISHYLEHLVFKGTKHYSCQQIKEAIEGVGGSFNGFTSEEATCFFIKAPSRYLERCLDILAEMVLYPKLAVSDIEKERTVILEEIKMYKDLPQSYVHELIDELLWPNQPLGRSILGKEETITRITRSDLENYRKQYYTSANIVISAAGNLCHSQLVRKIKKLFNALPCSLPSKFSAVELKQTVPQLRILNKDTEQTHLIVGFHGLSRLHPQRYAQSILHIILGGNSSSRLFNEIREKRGLAYEIGTQVQRLNDTGAFFIHAGVDNNKVLETIQLIIKEINRIRIKKIGKGELRRAKEYLIGQLTLSLEDSLDQMLWIGEQTIMLNRVDTLKKVKREINAVGLSQIHQVADFIFCDSRLNLALIGPQKHREQAIKELLSIGK
ncbi:MAG: insulinase family protein [Candidatus Omnitrophica bacterium]|nr:insulinase family protein [Candidatus Omnitrophota bacterium]